MKSGHYPAHEVLPALSDFCQVIELLGRQGPLLFGRGGLPHYAVEGSGGRVHLVACINRTPNGPVEISVSFIALERTQMNNPITFDRSVQRPVQIILLELSGFCQVIELLGRQGPLLFGRGGLPHYAVEGSGERVLLIACINRKPNGPVEISVSFIALETGQMEIPVAFSVEWNSVSAPGSQVWHGPSRLIEGDDGADREEHVEIFFDCRPCPF